MNLDAFKLTASVFSSFSSREIGNVLAKISSVDQRDISFADVLLEAIPVFFSTYTPFNCGHRLPMRPDALQQLRHNRQPRLHPAMRLGPQRLAQRLTEQVEQALVEDRAHLLAPVLAFGAVTAGLR